MTQQTYTRLEHTLGVFSLTAHWFPDAPAMRAAALLHDIGHLPFSHTAEGLGQLDHHRIGQQKISALDAQLARFGLDRRQVEDCLRADADTALVTRSGTLSIDHLDSFVRSARCEGRLAVDPRSLLDEISPVPGGLSATAWAAELLVDLVCEEARLHTSWANIGPTAILRGCVQALLDAGHDPGDLAVLTDDGLWALLDRTPDTAAEAHRLRYEPHLLTVAPVPAGDSRRTYGLRKIYRSAPFVDGRPLARVAPHLEARLAALEELPRDFHVAWEMVVEDSGRA